MQVDITQLLTKSYSFLSTPSTTGMYMVFKNCYWVTDGLMNLYFYKDMAHPQCHPSKHIVELLASVIPDAVVVQLPVIFIPEILIRGLVE
jgi:hypothetical protein